MKAALLVFLGGGLGSMLRYGIGRWVGGWFSHHFPLGTLLANVAACFALGIILGMADSRQLMSASSRVFWTIGFCGGFSTFSTFSNDTLSLIQAGFTPSALLYIGMSLAMCLLATWGGLFLGQGT